MHFCQNVCGFVHTLIVVVKQTQLHFHITDKITHKITYSCYVEISTPGLFLLVALLTSSVLFLFYFYCFDKISNKIKYSLFCLDFSFSFLNELSLTFIETYFDIYSICIHIYLLFSGVPSIFSGSSLFITFSLSVLMLNP